MDDIIESPEESGLLIKVVSETFKNEATEQKGGFFGMLLGTLGANFQRNLLKGKGVGSETYLDEKKCEDLDQQLELVKVQLEQARIFNATSSFN